MQVEDDSYIAQSDKLSTGSYVMSISVTVPVYIYNYVQNDIKVIRWRG